MKQQIKNVKQLLQQVNLITNSYERVSKANGENFNIFSILNIEANEVSTHSRFIAELLNPKGCHGFKGRFLELFINTLSIKTTINPEKCDVNVEFYTGKVTETSGGNIDILIREPGSEENVIMIENKIYAGEQENQLLRYHNAFPKGKLLFLTLSGYESDQISSKGKYECISYIETIINWLEACRKEAVNIPILRETLTQYINLIKKLTNQNSNTEMKKDLVEIFTKNTENFNSFTSILELKNDIKAYAFQEKVIPSLEELKKEIEGFDFDENFNDKYSSLCYVENDKLKSKNLKILFEFQSGKSNGLVGGFVYLDNKLVEEHDYSNLKQNFKNCFKGIPCKENQWWIFFDYWHYMNLDSNLSDLKNLIFGDFKNDLQIKITKMLELVDSSF